MQKSLVIIALIFSLPLKILASAEGQIFLMKEGFSSQPPAANLMMAWDNTFLFEFLNPGKGLSFGSTSLVFKEQRNGEIYLGLLTNKHVHRSVPEYQMSLYKNIKQHNATYTPVVVSAERMGSVQYVSSTLSNDFDLALFIVKVSVDEGQNLKPLQMSQDCRLSPGDSLVTIGFPRTVVRVANKADENNEQIWRMKRWSSGVFVGDTKQGRGPIFGTTVDALQGSSGGPVLDTQGNLVGVMTAITGPIYSGSEDPKDLIAYSYIVDCQAIKGFAQNSWQNFWNSKREAFLPQFQ